MVMRRAKQDRNAATGSLKDERQEKIIELLAEEPPIGDQEALREALEKAGHKVSQATVSRDISDLELTTENVNGIKRYRVDDKHASSYRYKRLKVILKESCNLKKGVLNQDVIKHAVVFTKSGYAGVLAERLNSLKERDQQCKASFLLTIPASDCLLIFTDSDQLLDEIRRVSLELR